MPIYVKKPLEIEARQLTRDNLPSIIDWIDSYNEDTVDRFDNRSNSIFLNIRTLEGIMCATEGDYIIRGIKDEFYPCKEDIFLASYEEKV